MELYRALVRLWTGKGYIEKGEIFLDSAMGTVIINRLLELGRISVAHTPPLRELPGWSRRASVLAQHDILTVEDFFSYDDKFIADIFDYKEATIARWRKEVLYYLTPQIKGG